MASLTISGMRFRGCPVNRAAALSARKDPAVVRKLRESSEARFIVVESNRILVKPTSPVRLAWQSREEILNIDPVVDEFAVYLGPVTSRQTLPQQIFAVQIQSNNVVSADLVWLTGRELMMSDAANDDVAIAGLALGLTGWHQTALHEGRTGKLTVPIEGGMKRQVEGGTAKVYPRTDPVVIGLIVSPDGARCLLGRGHKHAAGMYTCLSGFIDQCEGVEEALAREAMEEAGVKLCKVELVASQPWPIGRAGSCELMIGCRAVASSDHVEVNKAEIEDARWFTKAEVKRMLAQSLETPWKPGESALFVPPPQAIAHHLIKSFVASEPPENQAPLSQRRILTVGAIGILVGMFLARLPMKAGSRM